MRKKMLLIPLILLTFILLDIFIIYPRTCSDKCFMKDDELWCEGSCWNAMERVGIKPKATTITECDMWGFGYGCE